MVYHPRRPSTTAWVVLVTLAGVVALTAALWDGTAGLPWDVGLGATTWQLETHPVKLTRTYWANSRRVFHVRHQNMAEAGRIYCVYAGPWRFTLWVRRP